MMENRILTISPDRIPKVLFIGNGIVRLAGGGGWDKLLETLNGRNVSKDILENVPFAMLPEVMNGVNVEEVQRKTSQTLENVGTSVHPLLRELLKLPFDAILTTNYTYEIETVLSAKPWNNNRRREAYRALHGSVHVTGNTSVCNLVRTEDGRQIPVFHIHGEQQRKHSMILSYYSYAKAVAGLYALNKERGNQYEEKALDSEAVEVWSWLDYFILGEVYSVGFGFDFSEFDVWWAMERKAREHAPHGKLHMYMAEKTDKPLKQTVLAEAMDAEVKRYDVTDNFEPAYEKICEEIKRAITTVG